MARTYTPEERVKKMKLFLKAYAREGVFTPSCQAAGVDVHVMRKWVKKYPKFARLFEEMQERFTDSLEMVAIERARDKSDTLMALLLRANRPDKYKDNHKIESNVNTSPIQLVFTREEWGDAPLPNFVNGGEEDAEDDEHSSDNSESESPDDN